MRYYLLLFTAFALVSCGSCKSTQPTAPHLQPGMRSVVVFSSSVALNSGDWVDVIVVDNGSETTIVKHVEVAKTIYADKAHAIVTLIAPSEEADKIVKATDAHIIQLRRTTAN